MIDSSEEAFSKPYFLLNFLLSFNMWVSMRATFGPSNSSFVSSSSSSPSCLTINWSLNLFKAGSLDLVCSRSDYSVTLSDDDESFCSLTEWDRVESKLGYHTLLPRFSCICYLMNWLGVLEEDSSRFSFWIIGWISKLLGEASDLVYSLKLSKIA